MRGLMILMLLGLAGCGPVSPNYDWYAFLDGEQREGRMRADRTPADAPVDNALLEQSFRRIAFDLERDPLRSGEDQVTEADRPMIRKWTQPVRFAVASAPGDRQAIAKKVEDYTDKLAKITQHPMGPYQPDQDQDVRLLILYGEDAALAYLTDPNVLIRPEWSIERQIAARWLSESIREWRYAPSPCAGFVHVGDARTNTPTGEILFGLILIRKEVPALLLDACIEEELAQVMGVLNDDERVRPSIFNDDQEFALLTEHDTQLLRMLYDPRIQPGMSPTQAMPIVRELLGIGG